MSGALIRKEAREHGIVITLTLAGSALGLWAFLDQDAISGGRFSGLLLHAYIFTTLLSVVLAARLFSREYSGRTQLFLETLPITRLRVFSTKWLLGAAVLVLSTLLTWAVTWAWVRRREILGIDAASGVLLTVLGLALALWSFAVMAAMLGRYRYLMWGLALFAGALAHSQGGIEYRDLPLLRLLSERVSMAQGLPDTVAWIQAGTILVVCLIASLVLALRGAGAMASALARRMTARERAFFLVASLAVLGINATLTKPPTPPPFASPGVEPLQGAHVQVSVLGSQDWGPDTAREIAAAVVKDVDSLIDAVRLEAKPAVFLQTQQGLDRWAMQRAYLYGADGVVLKMAPDVPRDMLRILVLHSVLLDASDNRMDREDRHVLLDGLATYWVLRDDPAARDRWWLRAAALPQPVSAATLTQWSRTSEEVGECLSEALAFAMMDTLVTQVGRDRVLEWMQDVFARQPTDLRVLFEVPPARRLAALGMDWPQLAAATEASIARARSQYAAALQRRARVSAVVTQEHSPAQGLTVQARVTGAPAYWVLYQELGPWTADAFTLSRLDARTPQVILPLSPQPGAKFLTAIELEDTVLECPVRVAAERLRLR